jgi:hypothetical protein
LDRLLILKAIETAPSGFAIPGHLVCGRQVAGQVHGMLAKGALDRLDRELVERIANGSMGRRTLPTQATQRLQPCAARMDKTLDLPVGRGSMLLN